MAVKTKIIGNDRNETKVTKIGELVTSPFSYSTPIAFELNAVDTAFNLVEPKTGCRIVVTDILVYGNKNVGVNDATFEIYTADAYDSTTVISSIFKTEVVKQASPITFSGLNWVTDFGVWLNAKTDDATIFVVIAAYYIPSDIDTNFLV
jgi:hypothetical protein